MVYLILFFIACVSAGATTSDQCGDDNTIRDADHPPSAGVSLFEHQMPCIAFFVGWVAIFLFLGRLFSSFWMLF